MVIKLSEQDRNERLALRLPTIFHAYKLWVNGELLTEVGVVGQDKSGVTPHLATKLVFFQPENDRVELVMQVANFHHNRGGITKDIELGGSDVLEDTRTVAVHISNLRKKIEADPAHPERIITIRGAGYMLVASSVLRART